MLAHVAEVPGPADDLPRGAGEGDVGCAQVARRPLPADIEGADDRELVGVALEFERGVDAGASTADSGALVAEALAPTTSAITFRSKT